jgi:hypothetical protein
MLDPVVSVLVMPVADVSVVDIVVLLEVDAVSVDVLIVVSVAAVSVFMFSSFLQPNANIATTKRASRVRTADFFIVRNFSLFLCLATAGGGLPSPIRPVRGR